MSDSKNKTGQPESTGDSTWSATAATGEWNDARNWNPGTVPGGKASFNQSGQTEITFNPTAMAEVEVIEFDPTASPYCFKFGTSPAKPALTISGDGIINNSTNNQSFIVASIGTSVYEPQLKFCNKASAGVDTVTYYAGPESLENGYGGGIIAFWDYSNAGSASFTVRTGRLTPPGTGPVGAEVNFRNYASAATATFTIYGTIGSDGYTFGNVVFSDAATADHGTFTNIGGTVATGDGGNTQFYDNSTAAYGTFHNFGGSFPKANGGDVAFDSSANGGYAQFHNRAATVAGAYGGVTSFNNNPNRPPDTEPKGASAGFGTFINYGAMQSGQGGGGHTEFTAKYGNATAGNGKFINYGSTLCDKSSAGHTIFSTSDNNPDIDFFPTAANGVFWNFPAMNKGAAAGFTEFAVYRTGDSPNVPTAGNGTFYNLGGNTAGAAGGYTVFKGTSTAANATLIAAGGTNEGSGGRIAFYDKSSGGDCKVILMGNGELEIGSHEGPLSIGVLELTGGIINTQLGTALTTLNVGRGLTLLSKQTNFFFWKSDKGGFEFNKAYTILSAPNLSGFTADQFTGNAVDGAQPTFTLSGNELQVSFNKN
jgi:hypothetical protein